MRPDELAKHYHAGRLATHEFVVCMLAHVNELNVHRVLGLIPPEAYPRLQTFLEQYREGEMVSSRGGEIPSPQSIRLAKEWLTGQERTP